MAVKFKKPEPKVLDVIGKGKKRKIDVSILGETIRVEAIGNKIIKKDTARLNKIIAEKKPGMYKDGVRATGKATGNVPNITKGGMGSTGSSGTHS